MSFAKKYLFHRTAFAVISAASISAAQAQTVTPLPDGGTLTQTGIGIVHTGSNLSTGDISIDVGELNELIINQGIIFTDGTTASSPTGYTGLKTEARVDNQGTIVGDIAIDRTDAATNSVMDRIKNSGTIQGGTYGIISVSSSHGLEVINSNDIIAKNGDALNITGGVLNIKNDGRIEATNGDAINIKSTGTGRYQIFESPTEGVDRVITSINGNGISAFGNASRIWVSKITASDGIGVFATGNSNIYIVEDSLTAKTGMLITGNNNRATSGGKLDASDIGFNVKGDSNTVFLQNNKEFFAKNIGILFDGNSNWAGLGIFAHIETDIGGKAIQSTVGTTTIEFNGNNKLTNTSILLSGADNKLNLLGAGEHVFTEVSSIDLGTNGVMDIAKDASLKIDSRLAKQIDIIANLINNGNLSIVNNTDNILKIDGNVSGDDQSYTLNENDFLYVTGDVSGTINFNLANTDIFASRDKLAIMRIDGDVSGVNFPGSLTYGSKIFNVTKNLDASDMSDDAKMNFASAAPVAMPAPASPTYIGFILVPDEISDTGAIYESIASLIYAGRSNILSDRLKSRSTRSVPANGDFMCINGVEYGLLGCRKSGVWSEIDFTHTKHAVKKSSSGIKGKTDAWELTAGYDLALNQIFSENNRWVISVSGSYGKNMAKGTSKNGGSRANSTNYGLNLEGTWYNHDSFYVDLVGNLVSSRTDLFSNSQGLLKKNVKGRNYAMSAEIGQEFWLDNHWKMTPIGHIGYSHIDSANFTDAYGVHVKTKSWNDYWLRMGGSAEYNFAGLELSDNQSPSIYISSHVTYSYAPDYITDVDGIRLYQETDNLYGYIGLGGSFYITPEIELYSETSYAAVLSGNFNNNDEIKGTAGIKMEF